MQNLNRFSKEILLLHLDGRVAASVKNQIRVGAEQSRGVDALSQIALEFAGFLVRPE